MIKKSSEQECEFAAELDSLAISFSADQMTTRRSEVVGSKHDLKDQQMCDM